MDMKDDEFAQLKAPGFDLSGGHSLANRISPTGRNFPQP